ncbi:MAG: protein-L-isoaspartate O-methyltransferase [Bacteroides sp. SM23_62_1]|nr:MAG: protein-L-isoaspartate O-methyltransferase [Bacteroides sp. SM23_62_1]
MEDTYRHKGLRRKLVETVRMKGIMDERVLRALDTVPRHLFMDSSFIKFSYQDQAFPIGAGQTISQPYTVAFQTELLDVSPNDKVLEIGTGSGYQTAILLELGAIVYTIERQKELYIKAQDLLTKLGYKPHFFFSDGMEGKPTYGPYDRILVTAAATEVPEKLLQQLKIGGIMVIPVGDRFTQSMVKIVKESESNYKRTNHGSFVFVPLITGTEG